MQRRGAHRLIARCAILLGPAVWLMLAGPWMTLPAAAPPEPYAVKAAFMYNLARFIEWPSTPPPDPEAAGECRFRIGVLGDDPFGSILDEIAKNGEIGGLRLSIRRFEHASELEPCEIIFIAVPEEELADALRASRRVGTLTVGEGKRFVQSGGAIALDIQNSRIRFDVNLAAIEEAALEMSSKLLDLARTVDRWPLAKEEP